MDQLTITPVCSPAESKELDLLLWEVLWRPLGLPRNLRDSFKHGGVPIEVVAKTGKILVGGLAADWTSSSEVEIRHLALREAFQKQGIGCRLVTSLISIVTAQGCHRLHTIARNTSVGFFRKLGFTASIGMPPEHPDFKKHGITFELMERKV